MQQPTERLPVNPRRHKVAPENRKRVARACNSCNVRRIKCSGERPCQQCANAARECVYPSAEPNRNVQLKEELERLRKRCAALEKGLRAVVPDDAARQELVQQIENPESPSSQPLQSENSYATDEAEATEGRLLFDMDGNVRFLGETSGATFLDLLKHFMLTLVPLAFVPGPGHTAAEDGSTFVASIGHYQTFDSRPLHDPEVDPLWLPSRTDMTIMLTALSYHIQDGNGDFLCGGIYYWGDINAVPAAVTLAPSHVDAIKSNNYRYLAFYNICFAFATHVLNYTPAPDEENAGDRYFKRAQILLGNPLDTVRFTLRDVPALALMGFYLVEINRRDSAYMYISLAIHIAITHGAFRHCVDESSKRVFWTLYTLDRWLSCLMGRPPTLIDEAIRLPMPVDVPNLPSAAGLRAHIEFVRVSNFIVCETFKIAPRDQRPSQLTHNIDRSLKMLQDWLAQLPPSLQLNPVDYSLDPTCCTLHMAYNQLTLLTTRPIFFSAVKRAVAERYINGSWRLESDPQLKQIQACSSAAHSNICIAQWVNHLYKHRRVLQASLHIVFNAAIILMLNRILRAYADAVESEIEFAINLFAQESRTGSNYQKDCLQVLRDLNTIVNRFLTSVKMGTLGQGFASNRTALQQVLTPMGAYGNQQSISGPVPVPTSLDAMGGGQYVHTFNDTGNAYQELMTWTQTDGAQSSNTFRI
ncbi:hypothetical protein CC80DRAFT_543204 [Byssothecium circinans]|uniref:Zn(2)-C6 fungal-type domain-containing protein n=1 Tax=Byssothecium circinans TaxID=147558 RepID=A0A6A5UAB5_9PLEO|nr:hypothetical protein CC80DRAFT_543204 [Byssothecium circinans]